MHETDELDVSPLQLRHFVRDASHVVLVDLVERLELVSRVLRKIVNIQRNAQSKTLKHNIETHGSSEQGALVADADVAR